MALADALEGASRAGLNAAAQATSEAYRQGGRSDLTISDRTGALAYAVARAPATYAACRSALESLAEAAPSLRPESLLDAGCGTGAAGWAAAEVFGKLRSSIRLDANRHLLAVAEELAVNGPALLARAEVRRANLLAGALPRADLVISSYVLAELAEPDRTRAVDALWGACGMALLLVEPGTPEGWRRILAARDELIAAGANIAAPCPHAAACPIKAPDWCHFSVRLARSRDHRQAKGGAAPFEDEKFAYVAAVRGSLPTVRPSRILARPHETKAGVAFKLCGPEGAASELFVPRRDKPAHALARRASWGRTYPAT